MNIKPKQIQYLDEIDLMLGAEGLHQLDVHGLIAVGSKDAEMGLTSMKEQGEKRKKKELTLKGYYIIPFTL